ncbi:MAG: acetyl-CoA carboxylase biotin carboxyl carrier protein subunit [Halioglobus sp.]|nr:acetyl-CoA carboxylase biotin carboxyl carrier protein subunit [Halioglobus sp.]|tara:strand:- start:13118 stop:14071 length:954 start_codon:yes stop_codon:yes gene_type:complete
MNLLQTLLVVASTLGFAWGPAYATESSDSVKHDHEYETEGGHEEVRQEEEAHVRISLALAEQSGLRVAEAGPMVVTETRTSYGRLVTDPERLAHVTGRFNGQVRRVEVSLGDAVKAGDALAVIESNESLQSYTVTAPIAGTITQRNVNVGELVNGQPLFAIADLDTLWAELKIFPGQREDVSIGQQVRFAIEDKAYDGNILHLLPSKNDAPYVVARVAVDNNLGLLSPGLLVTAKIVVESSEVQLAVDRRGIQQFENRTVVFVQEGETYEPRPVVLGRSDERVAEVRSGLEPGDKYVVENSYLIKADLEKSSATHEH